MSHHLSTALMVAVRTQNLATTKFLIEIAQADPNLKDNNGMTALDFAKRSGKCPFFEVIKFNYLTQLVVS